ARGRDRACTPGFGRGRLSRRRRAGMAGALARQSESPGTGALAVSALVNLVADLAAGRIRMVDLTHTLSPDFPQIVLPPEMGQCWPFRVEEVSHYDDR